MVKIPVFHFFEKVNEGQLKMVNVNRKPLLLSAIIIRD